MDKKPDFEKHQHPEFDKNKQHIEKNEAKSYWRRLMDSTCNKISRGAQQINRIITWARGDNWRRKNEKK